MKEIRIRIVLSVASGTSALARRSFSWGSPVAPFSVGTRADWPIYAPGVEETHLYLTFDGYRLHAACASPESQVSVDGSPLSTHWLPLSVPCNLRFGGARLLISSEEEEPAALPRAAVDPRQTLILPSPVVNPMQTARMLTSPHGPVPDLKQSDQQQTQVVDLAHTLQLRTQRVEVSESLLNELREAPRSDSAVVREAAPFQSAPVTMKTLSPVIDLASTLCDGGALRERAAQLVAHEPPAPLIRPLTDSAHAAREAANQRAEPARDRIMNRARPRVRSSVERAWRAVLQSSPPRKLTVLLLPLAAAGVCAMRNADDQSSTHAPAAVRRAAQTASALRSPPPVAPRPTTAPSPLAAPPPDASDALPSPPRRDLAAVASERAALAAAFNGNKAEAAALYEGLAASRQARVFSEAARLAREDRIRKP